MAVRTLVCGSSYSAFQQRRYTFNDYGSKIPLHEFRETTEDAHGRVIVLDADPEDTMNVFMVMDKVGDYEVKYGNPNLKTSNEKSRKTACRCVVI